MNIKTLCVYCGSSLGRQQEYLESARVLAEELVKRDIDLVYGGASVGIMGEIADTVLAAGGNAIGVIPQSLVDKEVSHQGLTQLHIVDSMHKRKSKMIEISDAFVALPGGMGTLEEMFEVLTWSQLGFHQKPCALLNVNGYYNHLSAFLNHAVAEEFIKAEHKNMLIVDDSPIALLNAIEAYEAPTVSKWISK